MAGRKPAGKVTANNEIDTKAEETVTKEIVPKDVDPATIVLVKNGFQGKLIYVSPRTHERYEWDSFGDEQEMELRELRNAKSSAKKFFENNWFMFDDDNKWVIPYLGLKNFYKYAVDIDKFDDLFKLPPDKLKEAVGNLSKGQKRSVSYRARQMVMDREIDSLKTIAALEEALGIELIEK